MLLLELKIKLTKENRVWVKNLIRTHQYKTKEILEMIASIPQEKEIVLLTALDLLVEETPSWILKDLDQLLLYAQKQKNETAKRSLSRMFFHAIAAHLAQIDELLVPQLIALNFDWLIENSKVATKVYAIRSLQLLSICEEWVQPELIAIINQQIPLNSQAFRNRGIKVIKTLKTKKNTLN